MERERKTGCYNWKERKTGCYNWKERKKQGATNEQREKTRVLQVEEALGKNKVLQVETMAEEGYEHA